MIDLIIKMLQSLKTFVSGDVKGNMPSPRVDIAREDIICASKDVTVRSLKGVAISTVQGTNSMEPLIDIGHTIILSNNSKYVDALDLGSIIIWNYNGERVIHSIIEIDSDSDGWYCKTQGLNITRPDSYRIRKRHIEQVLLGVIFTRQFSEGYTASDGD